MRLVPSLDVILQEVQHLEGMCSLHCWRVRSRVLPSYLLLSTGWAFSTMSCDADASSGAGTCREAAVVRTTGH